MNKILWSILGFCILIGVVIVVVGVNENRKVQMMKESNVEVTIEDQIKDKAMMETGDEMMMEKDMMEDKEAPMGAGVYGTYDPTKIAKAATPNIVLFFRASWCPSCRVVDKDIKVNLTKIPKNLTILDVDYDNSTDLKKKYGVTYQHTFVQVDKDGNMIKKWSGSPTLSALVTEIK